MKNERKSVFDENDENTIKYKKGIVAKIILGI